MLSSTAEDGEIEVRISVGVGPNLHKLDITDSNEVRHAILNFKPNIIIHCAANRFPDKVDLDPNGATKINVDATKSLALIADTIKAPMIYISTDYVFDGKSPPFSEDDTPNPLNLYGKTKLQGELATLSANPDNIVFRIPVIYGPIEKLSESAVTVLLETLLDTSKKHQVSNFEKRNPSHVDDIAVICYSLARKRLQRENISGIYQWCGKETLTKYEMVLQMAGVFNLPHSHITPASDPPALSSAVRPYDTRLDTTRVVGLGITKRSVKKVSEDGSSTEFYFELYAQCIAYLVRERRD
uniref:Methionine adenosyltransferase 2 subunit beta n=1 Tax=Timema douglasi TaxID=61478 RepID=A0A7R8VM38_TIMDO|nr:unnamed protein product [Timema douglasi]